MLLNHDSSRNEFLPPLNFIQHITQTADKTAMLLKSEQMCDVRNERINISVEHRIWYCNKSPIFKEPNKTCYLIFIMQSPTVKL